MRLEGSALTPAKAFYLHGFTQQGMLIISIGRKMVHVYYPMETNVFKAHFEDNFLHIVSDSNEIKFSKCKIEREKG